MVGMNEFSLTLAIFLKKGKPQKNGAVLAPFL